MKKLSLLLSFLLMTSTFSKAQQPDSLSIKQNIDSIIVHGQELIGKSTQLLLNRMNYALETSKKYGWKNHEAEAYMYLGMGNYYLADFPKALENYYKSLELFEELKYDQGVAQVSNELGVFYSKQEDYEKSLKFYKKAQEIASKNNFNKELAISLSNQAMSYFKRGMYNESLPLMHKALEIKTAINDSIGMGYELKRIATYHFVKENYPEGLEYLNRSTAIRTKIGDKNGIAINTVTIAEMYQGRGQYEKAIRYFKETYKQAKEIAYADLAQYTLEMMKQCYAALGNYKLAYEYQVQARDMADSIFNEQKSKAVLELETKYETAKKEQLLAEQELSLANKETELKAKQSQVIGLVGGIIILVLFGLIFYNAYKNRQDQKMQLAILEEKERGFESVIQATEEERKRISKDLHDGIGQQLSALKMGLQTISGNIKDQDQKEGLLRITEQFSKSAEEVRQISHQMMPRTLLENGLVEAIEDLLKNSFQFSEMEYTFEHHNVENERFEERIEISLYRVLQELIHNIIKHSGASEVSVQLLKNKGKLLLFVEDNGIGMKNTSGGGHGLVNITSRLDKVKGSVNYEPSPASGTSVTVTVPVA